MATLKNEHKAFIVKQLACYEKPTEIQKLLQENFDIEVPLSQLSYYNPENTQGKHQLSPKWIRLHDTTRDKFIEGAIDIPTVHKMYRIKMLDKIAHKAYNMGNTVEARAALEQIAKELGGAYEDIQGKLGELADRGGINLYQQINQKIDQYYDGSRPELN